MEKERHEAMAPPQLASLAAREPGVKAEQLRVCALPQDASLSEWPPSSCGKPASLIAWVAEQSLLGRATSISLINHTKGVPWPDLVGLIFSFLTGSRESGLKAGAGWRGRQTQVR